MDNVNQVHRKKNRRTEEHRRHARRINQHAFGTEQWRLVIEASYAFWPKEDRRLEERRSLSRREEERRTGLANYRRQSLRQQVLRRSEQKERLTTEDRLTTEEIKMLNEMNKHF